MLFGLATAAIIHSGILDFNDWSKMFDIALLDKDIPWSDAESVVEANVFWH